MKLLKDMFKPVGTTPLSEDNKKFIKQINNLLDFIYKLNGFYLIIIIIQVIGYILWKTTLNIIIITIIIALTQLLTYIIRKKTIKRLENAK